MTTLDLNELKPIPGPFEIMELADRETLTITPERWELGKAKITPRDGRPEKEIRILRLHVSPADKPTLPHYWDVTSAHLVAGLVGYLDAKSSKRLTFRITKQGTGPRARFTLDATPAEV